MEMTTIGKFPSFLGFIILLIFAWDCGAEETPQYPHFSINGYGTLGVVHSSETQADFVSNAYQPKGPGYSGRWSATPDSKLGVQVTMDFSDKLSATVQFLSQYQYDATFTPDIEWLNIKYQVTPDFSVRVGRIALPTYKYSDSLNVGYVMPFVRMPLEIYAQLPVTHNDGIDMSYRFRIGEVTNTVQVFSGNSDSKVPGNFEYTIRDLRGIADTLEYGDMTLRFSYQKLRYSFSPFHFNDHQQILAIGASYDPGQWFVLGEWIRSPDDNLGLFYGWYAIGGVRVGKFTPYLGYARTYMTDTGSLGFPPLVDQDTATLGLRWDFMDSVDLKLQFEHTDRHGGWNAFFANQQPGFQPDSSVNLFSLTVDFVF